MQIPQAAFCALEAYRWAFRSVLRLHGYRFVKLLQQPITTPTLQLHGALDPAILPRTAQGSSRTWPLGTSGGFSTGSATFRTWRCPIW